MFPAPRQAALPQGRAARRFEAQIVCAAEGFDRGSIKANGSKRRFLNVRDGPKRNFARRSINR
jgi:hypothetical protein